MTLQILSAKKEQTRNNVGPYESIITLRFVLMVYLLNAKKEQTRKISHDKFNSESAWKYLNHIRAIRVKVKNYVVLYVVSIGDPEAWKRTFTSETWFWNIRLNYRICAAVDIFQQLMPPGAGI